MSDFNLVGIIKVMPTDPDVNLDELEEKIKSAIPEKFGFQKIEREPIAFGLVALNVYLLGKDAEGYSFDAVAEELEKIEEVESAQVTTVSRI
ncbi:effector protein [Palaeococcus pacificus DY20341]|uniref:Elongation factor 1-beta n=1 Tax=Palaeococcus pacificus DY20341 TaxID=1343739 RepID=A0A075LVQ5_9EURY|nr:elongation factor 1-beta [Palaeococcus pacificus]AIF68548.1 effector protein [Palaeococcus pacificus DY20341]